MVGCADFKLDGSESVVSTPMYYRAVQRLRETVGIEWCFFVTLGVEIGTNPFVFTGTTHRHRGFSKTAVCHQCRSGTVRSDNQIPTSVRTHAGEPGFSQY